MDKKYCVDWKERIEFLIPLFLKQVEDSHKSSDFLIQRSYNLLYLNAIFAFLVIQISHNAIVLSGLVLLLLVLVYSLKDALCSHAHMNQGLKPSVVDLCKEYEGKDLYLDLDDGYVVHKGTNTSNFYAWVIDCLDSQLQNSIKNGEMISKSYKQAQKASFIGIYFVIVLIFIAY